LAFGSGVTSVSTTGVQSYGTERNVGAYGGATFASTANQSIASRDVDRHDDGRGGATTTV